MHGGMLVGRAAELAAARRAVEDGSGALLAGDAGVGKTRLLREVIGGLHPERWCVLGAAATAPAATVPFGALAHLVSVPVRAGRSGGFARAAEELQRRAGGRKLLIWIDDAHELDASSAAFVHHLAAARRVPLVLTVLAGSQVPEPITALWKDAVLPRVALFPLSRAETDQLLEAMLGGQLESHSAERLWATTSGNLLFLEQLVADAREAGTLVAEHGLWWWHGDVGRGARLTELVAGRLADLPVSQRRLLEVLAVGEPLPVDVVEAVLPDADVAGAEQAGLVLLDGGDLRSGHPVYAQVLRAALGPAARRQWFRLLADALAHNGDELLRVAIWRLEAGQSLPVDQLVEAADLANRAGDSRRAEQLARARAASASAADRFAKSLQLGIALNDQGRFAEATEELTDLVGREPDDEARERLAWELCRGHFFGAGEPVEGLAACARFETAMRDPRLAMSVRALRGSMLAYAGQLDEATVVSQHEHTPAVPGIRTLATRAVTSLIAGETDEALVDAEAAVAMASRRGRPPPQLASLWVLSLQFAGRLDEAEEALATTAAPPYSAEAAMLSVLVGRNLLLRGRARSALRPLREASAFLHGREINGLRAWCLSQLAEAHAHLGHLDEADAVLAEARRLTDSGAGMFAGGVERAEAWVLAAGGDPTGGAKRAATVAETLRDGGQHGLALHAAHDAVRLGGRRHLGLARRVASSVRGPYAAAVAAYVDAADADDPPALDAAGRAFSQLGMSLVAAEVWCAAARAATTQALRGRAAVAARKMHEALAHCEEALTPALGCQADLPVLSDREAGVARLAADGLSNREIAERLGRSVRTVESHLYHAFAKLGVTDRAQLRAVLYEAESPAAAAPGA